MKGKKMKNQEEKAFVKFVGCMEQWMKASKLYVIHPERLKRLEKVCNDLQSFLAEEQTETKVEIKPCPLGLGDAVVFFVCDSLTVRDVQRFFRIVRPLRNFEVYPCENGMIRFAGIFQGVATVTVSENNIE